MKKTDSRVKQLKTKEKKGNKAGAKGMRVSMFAFLIGVALLPLIISVVIVSVLSFRITSNNIEESSKEMLLTVSRNLASHCIQNEITIINASSHYDYLDSLKSQDIEVAIIFENMSCETSIKNENGYRVREINCNEDLFKNPAKYQDGLFETNVQVEDNNYYACFVPIVNKDEITGVAFSSMPMEKLVEATNSMLIDIIVIAVILIVISVIVVLIFSKKVSKTFVQLGDRMTALSAGDLNKQKDQKSMLREMHILLDHSSSLQGNLQEIISKVKSVSGQLVNNIGEVTGLSDDASERARHILDSVNELTKSAEYMNVNVQGIVEQMKEIESSVNDMSTSVEQLHQHSENILETNNEAKINMDLIMEKSQQSVKAVQDIANQIHETNDSIERVDEAVAMILDISEETNLLSLNASIEAARAGEEGKGFAVIAGEIFQLSEQSAKSAEIIKQLARTITEDSQKSVDLAAEVQTMIMQEQDSIALTRNKYEELSEDIGHSADEIRSLAAITDQLSDYKEKVVENVHNLGAISEENAASNEEVNGNISEIISQVQNVNENCVTMNEMAQQLDESVMFFKD